MPSVVLQAATAVSVIRAHRQRLPQPSKLPLLPLTTRIAGSAGVVQTYVYGLPTAFSSIISGPVLPKALAPMACAMVQSNATMGIL